MVETVSSDGLGSYSDTRRTVVGVEYGDVGGENLIEAKKPTSHPDSLRAVNEVLRHDYIASPYGRIGKFPSVDPI